MVYNPLIFSVRSLISKLFLRHKIVESLFSTSLQSAILTIYFLFLFFFCDGETEIENRKKQKERGTTKKFYLIGSFYREPR